MSDYKKEMSLDNPLASKAFLDILRELIRDEIRKSGFNRMLPGIVTSVGSGMADVQLLGDGDSIANLPNKTGVILNINDEVYVELINGSSANMYIALKKG
jgi:hypothetical protein